MGNSHIAALRRGWAALAGDAGAHDVRFFAANSKLFNALELNRDLVFGVHRADRYEAHQLKFLDQVFGQRKIDLKDFDDVVIVGRNSNEVDFLRQFEPYSIDGLREDPARPALSQAAFARFCREIALKRLPDASWHGWDRPRLSFLPAPVPCADCPADDPRYAVWARFGADPVSGLGFLKQYRRHAAGLYGEHGMTLLSPPDDVQDANGLTRVSFGDEPARLHPRAGTFESSDFHHMGPRYGEIVLRHVLKVLG